MPRTSAGSLRVSFLSWRRHLQTLREQRRNPETVPAFSPIAPPRDHSPGSRKEPSRNANWCRGKKGRGPARGAAEQSTLQTARNRKDTCRNGTGYPQNSDPIPCRVETLARLRPNCVCNKSRPPRASCRLQGDSRRGRALYEAPLPPAANVMAEKYRLPPPRHGKGLARRKPVHRKHRARSPARNTRAHVHSRAHKNFAIGVCLSDTDRALRYSWWVASKSRAAPRCPGQLCLQSSRDFPGNVSFNHKNVIELSTEALGPKMRVVFCVDQLHTY